MSEPPTSASGSGLWPTPDASLWNLNEPVESVLKRRAQCKNGFGLRLQTAVKMPWPTPQSRDYKGARLDGKTSAGSQTNLNDAVRQEWATPSAADAVGSTGGGQGRSLRTDVRNNPQKDLWPTPAARDHKGGSNPHRVRNGKVQTDTLDRAVLASDGRGQLNPTFVEWLMGYPRSWTDLSPPPAPAKQEKTPQNSEKE